MTEELTRLGEHSWRVAASKQIAYEVHTHRGLFRRDDPFLADAILHGGDHEGTNRLSRRRLVIVDSAVHSIYGSQISDYFEAHDIRVEVCSVDANEATKQWSTVEDVLDAMVAFGIDRRREPVIAIGGGVLCDVVGMAASLYRRGTPYVRIPTSLIGLIDAGIGIKTGVNHAGGKNRIGTYANPTIALLDPTFLGTLPDRHLRNGMAEILKMALVKSAPLFDAVERVASVGLKDVFSSPEHALLADRVMTGSIQLMLEELQPNLWESNLERSVDYGHTFSPTIEMNSVSELLHGEAVAIDMALTTGISVRRGWMAEEEAQRVLAAIRGLVIDPWSDVLNDDGLLRSALADITKHRDGLQRVPLTQGIGDHRFVNDISSSDLRDATEFLRSSVLSEAK